MKKKKIIIGVIIVLTVVSFGAFGINTVKKQNPNSAYSADGETVKYELSTVSEAIETFKASGIVDVIDRNTIYATSDGIIKDILFEVGDEVKTGDVLFTYDEQYLTDLQNSLEDAKLNVEIAQVNLQGNRDTLKDISSPEVREIDILPLETQVYNAENAVSDYTKQLTTLEEDIVDADENIKEAQEDYDKQKTLFDNGLISQKELSTFEDVVKAQENAKKSIVTQKENLEDTIERAKYNLDVANKNLNYAKNPEENNKQQISQIENSIKVGELNLQQAQSNVKKIEEKINEFTLQQVSEIDGVVTKISVPKMSTVIKGAPVIEITGNNNDNFKVVLNVDQKYNSKLKLGQEVTVTSTALGDESVKGSISKILTDAKATQSGGAIVTAEVTFEEDVKGLKSGFSVDGEVLVNHFDNAIIVPIVAVNIDEDDQKYVYIINDDNIIERRDVTLGVIVGGDVQVDNIEEGEKIAVNKLKELTDGDTVVPIEKE